MDGNRFWIRLVVTFIFAAPAVTAQSAEYSTVARPDPDGTPTRVELSGLVNDVSTIDDIAQTYDADLFYKIAWVDPGLAGAPRRVMELRDVWNPRLLIMNLRHSTLTLPNRSGSSPTVRSPSSRGSSAHSPLPWISTGFRGMCSG